MSITILNDMCVPMSSTHEKAKEDNFVFEMRPRCPTRKYQCPKCFFTNNVTFETRLRNIVDSVCGRNLRLEKDEDEAKRRSALTKVPNGMAATAAAKRPCKTWL